LYEINFEGMKKILLAVVIILLSYYKTLSGDTIGYDVLRYNLKIDLKDLDSKTIIAEAEIVLVETDKMKNNFVFWLKGLTVDSVSENNTLLSFSIANELLIIQKQGSGIDTHRIKVYYHGQPKKDSYWGGFYFSSNDGGYAYNMGVAFNDVPHSYGRVWFPCSESFTDKALFSFEIITSSDKMAVCNGLLTAVTNNSDGNKTWHWTLNEPIPCYLASVAVGNYTLVKSVHQGIEKKIDIINACLPADSVKLKNSFQHLPDCINIFERKYLPYQFERVGFVLVPFTQGAMEHATNIAFPKYAADGSLSNETLMAHEFSHHWWGNLLTCQTPEDMWINEGWARWSEWLFLEEMYGKEAYQQEYLSNHREVLQYAHIRDKKILPVSPVPSDVTYGAHVYDKGGDIVHTLRNYLGDSLFFYSIHKILENNKFGNINSSQFRDSLTKYSGKNMNSFFNNWVFEKGFPCFRAEIRNYSTNTEVKVYQFLRFTDRKYTEVPLEITFYGDNMEKAVRNIVLNEMEETFDFKLPFVPQFAVINENMKLAEAKSPAKIIVKTTGSFDMSDALLTLYVNDIQDSALVYAEHLWVAPVSWPTAVSGIRFSDYRYWSFNGIFPQHFDAYARIKYNGKEGSMTGDNYLDHTLNIINEDSLVVLYRENISAPWNIYPDYKIITGSKTDKVGMIEIYHLKKGDYCLGVRDYQQSIKKSGQARPVEIIPYWKNDEITFSVSNELPFERLICYDTFGKVMKDIQIQPNELVKLNTSELSSGCYFFKFIAGNEVITLKSIKP